MEGQYSGVDILEASESAHNYNDYLTRLIRESTESKDLIDFGAGLGTFSRLLRSEDVDVTCVEPDLYLSETLTRDGFPPFRDLDEVPAGSFEFIFALNVLEHIKVDRAT